MSQESTDIEYPRDPVIEQVRADLLRRQQHGYVKYGGTLATNPADMRGKLQHAYEEALDLCNYLKWSIMEIDGYPELQPDPTHNTGLKDAKRDRLAVQIQTWIENYDPKLLQNVSTGALQDELHRRAMKVLGDPRERVTVGGTPDGGIANSCPHGFPTNRDGKAMSCRECNPAAPLTAGVQNWSDADS